MNQRKFQSAEWAGILASSAEIFDFVNWTISHYINPPSLRSSSRVEGLAFCLGARCYIYVDFRCHLISWVSWKCFFVDSKMDQSKWSYDCKGSNGWFCDFGVWLDGFGVHCLFLVLLVRAVSQEVLFLLIGFPFIRPYSFFQPDLHVDMERVGRSFKR